MTVLAILPDLLAESARLRKRTFKGRAYLVRGAAEFGGNPLLVSVRDSARGYRLRGERNHSGPAGRLRFAGEHDQVGVQPDALDSS